jgi:uncharacterized protein
LRVRIVSSGHIRMALSLVRNTLFCLPFVGLALFIAAMALGPARYKLTLYQFFFNEGFWLALPYAIIALATAVAALRVRRWGSAALCLLLAFAAGFAFYARYVEPSNIVVREQTIQVGAPLRVAFIADLHIGLFDKAARMQQITDELNRLNVDVVAVGGDWSYEPTSPLVELLAPIAKSRHRVIAVLGNHDEGLPGMRVVEELDAALKTLGVENIEGKLVEVNGVQIAGIGDRFANKDKLPAFDPNSPPHFVLGHNPDSVDRLQGTPIRLLLAGHTHGGQINLPFLTEAILSRFTVGKYKRGLYTQGKHSVFVTAGLGTVGLPLRLFQSPVIDVINLR